MTLMSPSRQAPSVVRAAIKLLAPNGAEDFAYWIAIKAVEDTILVVEAAGEAAAFQSVEEAIQESVVKKPTMGT